MRTEARSSERNLQTSGRSDSGRGSRNTRAPRVANWGRAGSGKDTVHQKHWPGLSSYAQSNHHCESPQISTDTVHALFEEGQKMSTF